MTKSMTIQMLNDYIWISKQVSNDGLTTYNGKFKMGVNSKFESDTNRNDIVMDL